MSSAGSYTTEATGFDTAHPSLDRGASCTNGHSGLHLECKSPKLPLWLQTLVMYVSLYLLVVNFACMAQNSTVELHARTFRRRGSAWLRGGQRVYTGVWVGA